MNKLVKFFFIFGPVKDNEVKVIKKYANPGQWIDESLMSTLCLPRIEFVDVPKTPKFQTFLVTQQDGHVLYGSGLIIYDRPNEFSKGLSINQAQFSPRSSQSSTSSASSSSSSLLTSPDTLSSKGKYVSYCFALITDIPFVHATRSLLHLIWDKRCDDRIVKSVMDIPLPARRACLQIVPPVIGNKPKLKLFGDAKSSSERITSALLVKRRNSPNKSNQQQQISPSENQSDRVINYTNNNRENNQHQAYNINDIYLYRGISGLPILDYPLRELFSFLQIDDLLLAFTCILMEFKTLIISQDNYKLMMVGETLTTLLLPLRWSNVYVPILPPDYGATYLDAPTSYIMGINTQVTELPDNLNHIQCKINCDEGRVVCDADSLALPLFLNDIKKQIVRILDEFQVSLKSKPFTYLDDLKFNRAIRVLFMKTIRKNILADYERYIMDVPESSSEVRQFDVVSYLSDQPKFMQSFLSKFLDTQLFASFIDENAKRMQQSRLSVFDMDPDELSEHFTDEALEVAFKNAQKLQLNNMSPSKIQNVAQRYSLVPKLPAQPQPCQKATELITMVKDLTKEILIETMGTDQVDTSGNMIQFPRFQDGSSPDGALIGKLCDLIERVWSHGAFVTDQDSPAAFCPLWSHLMHYAKLRYLESNPLKKEFSDGSHLNVLSTPSHNLDKANELDLMITQGANLFKTFNPFKSRSRFEKIGTLERDLLNDLSIINRLEEVKTGVGRARAFMRLSLERKKLSKHLKTLLSDHALLNSLYKPYAFLLHEEEREQFLMYLLTLNAVDLPCFTSTFINVINERRMKSPGNFALYHVGESKYK